MRNIKMLVIQKTKDLFLVMPGSQHILSIRVGSFGSLCIFTVFNE